MFLVCLGTFIKFKKLNINYNGKHFGTFFTSLLGTIRAEIYFFVFDYWLLTNMFMSFLYHMRTILINMSISLRCQDLYHCFSWILSSFIGYCWIIFVFNLFSIFNILTMSRFLSLFLMNFVEFYRYQCELYWIFQFL